MRNKSKQPNLDKIFYISLGIYIFLIALAVVLKMLKIELYINILSIIKNVAGVFVSGILFFILVSKVDEKRFGQKMMLASAVLLTLAFLLNNLLALIKIFFGNYLSNEFFTVVLIDFWCSAIALIIGLPFELVYKLREKYKK